MRDVIVTVFRDAHKTTCIGSLALFLAAVVLSCSGEPPEIRQVFWQLNVVHNPVTDLKHEVLSVFVHCADGDGVEDIDLLYILQDDYELLWELSHEGWQRLDEGEEVWIGSNNLHMDDGSPFPRKLFRIVVIDRSGERSRDEFYINTNDIDIRQTVFPKGFVRDESIVFEGGLREYSVWFYDNDYNLVKIFKTTAQELPLGSALTPRERQITSYFHVHAIEERGAYGLIYGPVSLE